jgi:hypothetical protein
VLGRLDEHHFQGRPHMRLDEMAAVCRPVRFADTHVRVPLWFALSERNITHQRQDFDLLGKRNALVILFFLVEIAHGDIAEGTDSREVATIEMMILGKVE